MKNIHKNCALALSCARSCSWSVGISTSLTISRCNYFSFDNMTNARTSWSLAFYCAPSSLLVFTCTSHRLFVIFQLFWSSVTITIVLFQTTTEHKAFVTSRSTVSTTHLVTFKLSPRGFVGQFGTLPLCFHFGQFTFQSFHSSPVAIRWRTKLWKKNNIDFWAYLTSKLCFKFSFFLTVFLSCLLTISVLLYL